MLDIICLIFIIAMAIYGYVKGFVVRLYDLIGTILVIFLSRTLCETLSSTYTLYHYDTSNALSIMIGQMINQIIIFILLFIGLTIIKKLLGMILKPLLLGITHFFSLTAFIDHLLGGIMSIAESLILIYLVLLFVVIPFNNNLITDSKLANYLLNVMPEVSESFMNMGECINNEDISDQLILNMMMSAYDYNFISEDSFISVLNEEIMNSDQDLTLSEDQYDKLNDILNELSYSQSDIDNILKNINIGDI
ncbi:MAG: CvpA family protein [Erysipelotrichaceae bacterium]|nr:CvpA family protein [Erysipelotrichaceae bacterium]